MDILQVLKSRYTTKLFDKTKKISEDDMQKVKQILVLSASSLNLQPWHFTIVESEQGKERMLKATDGMFSQNKTKIENSSAVVIFSAKNYVDDEYIKSVCDKEQEHGRFNDEIAKTNYFNARINYRKMHEDKLDVDTWLQKQLYLNLGNFLVSTAALGIDSCTMEGLDMAILDEEFSISERGYKTCFAVAIGYHDESDFNTLDKAPKSRFSAEDIIETV